MPKHELEVLSANKVAKILAWLREDKRPGEARSRFLYLCELNPGLRTGFIDGIDPITCKRLKVTKMGAQLIIPDEGAP